jgi:hypothetical protein
MALGSGIEWTESARGLGRKHGLEVLLDDAIELPEQGGHAVAAHQIFWITVSEHAPLMEEDRFGGGLADGRGSASRTSRLERLPCPPPLRASCVVLASWPARPPALVPRPEPFASPAP